ncbi:hypothetical protein [Flavobacterium restrictum]|uniref:Uncharacterized protein n=1 Tax=Flavobacterium restrictum TaxID=2594428 RepID=A0A553DWA9_9FLAO|nr:hypothetical protein [Flavobacterium restrictum]TRX37074.1 hypothetical protein FNW21_12840 [Flavobacterium restrictum]
MIQFLETIKLRNETLFYFGLLCFVFAALFLVLTKTTTVQVYNVSAWYKPFKFALSTFLYSWAMAWYCYYLPDFNIGFFNWSIIILLGFEIVYIAIQANKGQLSHYNTSTSLYSFLYAMMAIAATLATLYTAYVGLLFFTTNFHDLPNHYVWSIRLGIVIFVIFSFEGFVMGTKLTHTIGGEDGAAGIPILNWSTKYGDPRIAHFIGMHALQVIPLISYYLLKNTKATIAIALLYLLLSIFTLIQALQGKSFFK